MELALVLVEVELALVLVEVEVALVLVEVELALVLLGLGTWSCMIRVGGQGHVKALTAVPTSGSSCTRALPCPSYPHVREHCPALRTLPHCPCPCPATLRDAPHRSSPNPNPNPNPDLNPNPNPTSCRAWP